MNNKQQQGEQQLLRESMVVVCYTLLMLACFPKIEKENGLGTYSEGNETTIIRRKVVNVSWCLPPLWW